MRARLVAVMLLGLTASACAGAGGTADPEAGGEPLGSWVLDEGTDAGGAIPVIDDHDITLIVDGERWGGTAACNSYGATVTVEEDRLEIHEVWATEMACMDAGVMESEAAYLAAFGGAERFEVDDDVLTLYGDDIVLAYDSRPDAPDGDEPADGTDPDTPVSDAPAGADDPATPPDG